MAVPEIVTGADVFAYVGATGTYDATTPDVGTPSWWADTVAAGVNAGTAARLDLGDAWDDVLSSDAFAEIQVAALVAAGDASKRRETAFGLGGFDGSQRVARDIVAAMGPTIDRYRSLTGGIG